MQVAARTFRVPDICVIAADDLPDRFVTIAPLLCIEVLSPEDTYSRTQVKCRDYLAFGVAEVWVVDPEQKTVQIMTSEKTTTIDRGSIVSVRCQA